MSPPSPPDIPGDLGVPGDSGVHRVQIARGSIYLDRDLCQRFLPNVSCVAAMVRDGQVYLLPLRGPAAGGMLLKVRNARGDRVLHADEFLRTLGISADAPERSVRTRWDSEAAGLVLEQLAPQRSAGDKPLRNPSAGSL
jgi:hypothetical protein